MSEMIERVAAAIKHLDEAYRARGNSLMPIELSRMMAIGAIEAMCEPTEEMLAAGDMWDAPDAIWRTMIDEALK
jgi:hypothetical protein